MGIEKLLGKTLVNIDINEHKDVIIFTDLEGNRYQMFHEQECCEDVGIEEVIGDLNDLIGEPITMAEESTNREDKMGKDIYDDFTWTFYKLATIKGYVTIGWLGESNGCYSEDVEFVKL